MYIHAVDIYGELLKAHIYHLKHTVERRRRRRRRSS
jgi:hypothetical protein